MTGGCGFIGANLVPRLLESGARVRVLDDLSAGDPARLPDAVDLVEGDIRDPDAVRRAMDGVDAVAHLAAAGSVMQSIEDPQTNFTINAGGTLGVLDAAREAGVKRFVFASTGGALIGNAPPPVDEQSVPRPISPYGASKLAGEGYCHAFRGAYGLSTIALRFANVYGPHSERKGGAVTVFIKRALAGEPLPIFGDGSATRDLLYSDDLVAGIMAALASDTAGVVHLASERETSVAELARAGRGGCRRRHAASSTTPPGAAKSSATSHWHGAPPKSSAGARSVPLEDGLARTVEWFRPISTVTVIAMSGACTVQSRE